MSGGLAREALTRRAALAAASGLMLSGCAVPRWALNALGRGGGPHPATAPASPAGAPFPVALFPGVSLPMQPEARDLSALQAYDPHLAWQGPQGASAPAAGTSATASSSAAARPQWGVIPVQPWAPPTSYAPLDGAMRLANFHAATLLPGTLQAFTAARGPYAVPTEVAPTGVQYNVAAFTAAGLRPPAGDWTIDDFENACAALKGAIRAGRVPKIRHALAPMVGRATFECSFGGKPRPHCTQFWYGALSDPAIWCGFVLGYGGWTAKNGRFDLNNAGAVAGLSRLVSIAKQYGPPAADLPQSAADAQAFRTESAITFTSMYRYGQGPGKGYAFARFPRLPVRPVVPTTVAGAAPAKTAGNGGWTRMYPAGSVPAEALQAPVVYAQWLNSLIAANPALPTAAPPVVADATVQDAYWAGRPGHGAQAAADWRNYALAQGGWPMTPSANRTAAFLTQAQWIVLSALTEAVGKGTPLPGLLATATSNLNAAAAGYTSSALSKA